MRKFTCEREKNQFIIDFFRVLIKEKSKLILINFSYFLIFFYRKLLIKGFSFDAENNLFVSSLNLVSHTFNI